MVRRKLHHITVTAKRKSWQQKKYPRVKALQRYLKMFGHGEDGREGRTSFAKRLGTTTSYLVHLGLGNRRASMELAIKIEQESHKLVTVEDMLPSADWGYLATRKQLQRVSAA
jgi:DNA-binding transcriptional regulator YdaS (Cro superfamily)